MDVVFVFIAVRNDRGKVRGLKAWSIKRIFLCNLLSLIFFYAITTKFRNNDATAYFTGFLIQLFVSWGSVLDLRRNATAREHSLEIWCMRFLGTLFSLLVFFWRFMNVPETWGYVCSSWSFVVVGAWMAGDVVYFAIYLLAKWKMI